MIRSVASVSSPCGAGQGQNHATVPSNRQAKSPDHGVASDRDSVAGTRLSSALREQVAVAWIHGKEIMACIRFYHFCY